MLGRFLATFEVAPDQTDPLGARPHEPACHLQPDTTCSPDDEDRRLGRYRHPELIRFVRHHSLLCRSSITGPPACT